MPTKIIKQNVPVREFQMHEDSVFCFQIAQVPFRVDHNRAWDSDASHFQIKVWKKNLPKEFFIFEYSQGSAHKFNPHPRDIFRSLLEDAAIGQMSYADFIMEFGTDSEYYSWKIYQECTHTCLWFFKSRVYPSQLNEWRELFREAEEAGIEFDYKNLV